MLLKSRFWALLACLYSGHSLAATHEAPPSIRIGFNDFAPSIYADEQGQAMGPLADLVTRMVKHAGYTPVFRLLPSARLYSGLQDGSVELWAGTPDKPEFQGKTLSARRELARIELNLYYRPDTPAPHFPDDLHNKRLIKISGYSYWPKTNAKLEQAGLNIQRIRTSAHRSALELLLKERGDYMLDYTQPVEQARHELGNPALEHITLEEISIRFVASKHTPGAQQLLDRLDQVYDQMQAAGEDMYLP